MTKINVATFNVQNFFNSKYDLEKAKYLVNILKEYKINIIGLQEVSKQFYKYLEMFLIDENYFLSSFLYESNTIISNYPIVDKSIIWLSNTPDVVHSKYRSSIYERTLKILKLMITNNEKIYFATTHLDHLTSIARKKQLNVIYENIKKNNTPIILTGDFNTTLNSQYFKKFINNMNQINYKHITVNQKTSKYYFTNKAIDHFFIPKDFHLENTNVINTKYSDHPVLIITLNIQ